MANVVALVRESELAKRLWTTFTQHKKLSLWWLLCNLGGGLSPIWLAVFFRHAYGHSPNLFEFVMRGDLALLSAAFLSPAIFQVLMLFKRERTTLGIGAVVLAGIGAVLSAVLYSTTNPETLSRELSESINKFFVGAWSVCLLTFSITLAFATFLNDRHLEAADYEKLEQEDQAQLRKHVLAKDPPTADLGPPGDEGSEQVFRNDVAKEGDLLKSLFTDPSATDKGLDDDR